MVHLNLKRNIRKQKNTFLMRTPKLAATSNCYLRRPTCPGFFGCSIPPRRSPVARLGSLFLRQPRRSHVGFACGRVGGWLSPSPARRTRRLGGCSNEKKKDQTRPDQTSETHPTTYHAAASLFVRVALVRIAPPPQYSEHMKIHISYEI
jgi:hypothetical protein